jgi:nucleoid DNA-binding protein
MGLKGLPEAIQQHLLNIAAESSRGTDENYINELAKSWSRKVHLFDEQIRAVQLDLVQKIDEGDVRGILALTYSGSLLSLGPKNGDGRWMEYSSIKLRTDVPDIIVEKNGDVIGSLEVDRGISLSNSKVKQTSAVYKLAICPKKLSIDEQEKRIRESTIFLTNGFMKYNRSLQIDKANIPDQFTMKSMTRYLAKKHNMTGQEAKQVIDDFITLVETGMLLGESVPVGRLGRFSVKTRAAQKARLVKHPNTGEEIMVDAKPSMGVPKISFSTYIKERSEIVNPDDSEEEV